MALSSVTESVIWGAGATLVLVLGAILILRRDDIIRVIVGPKGFEVEFGNKLEEVRRKASANPDRKFATPESYEAAPEKSDLSARDMVLEHWGGFKQAVFDAVAAQNIPMTPAMNVPEAVDRLVVAAMLTPIDAEIIKVLYHLGHQISITSDKPARADAFTYRAWVDSVRDWLMTHLVLSAKKKQAEQEPVKPHRRQTAIAGSFPNPKGGQAVIALQCVDGPLQGRRFRLEKEHCRIGASPRNDLPIPGDDYVSGFHASLSYLDGSFWLKDEGSTNGTFLNGTRLQSSPMPVRTGDSIRVGKSTFKIQPG